MPIVIFGISGILDFVQPFVFYNLENTRFQKLDLFPSSSVGTLLGPLETANLIHWITLVKLTTTIWKHLKQGSVKDIKCEGMQYELR
jgi:hypothetical protein